VGRVHAVDLRRLEQDLALQLRRAQRRARVGGVERVARAGGQDHDPPLLEVPQRPPADERLGHRPDVQGAEHPRVDAEAGQLLPQGDGVHDRAEHAHVVGRRLVDVPGLGERRPADDVAPAHDDGELHPRRRRVADLLPDQVQLRRVDPEPARGAERLAAELEQHAGESLRSGAPRTGGGGLGGGGGAGAHRLPLDQGRRAARPRARREAGADAGHFTGPHPPGQAGEAFGRFARGVRNPRPRRRFPSLTSPGGVRRRTWSRMPPRPQSPTGSSPSNAPAPRGGRRLAAVERRLGIREGAAMGLLVSLAVHVTIILVAAVVTFSFDLSRPASDAGGAPVELAVLPESRLAELPTGEVQANVPAVETPATEAIDAIPAPEMDVDLSALTGELSELSLDVGGGSLSAGGLEALGGGGIGGEGASFFGVEASGRRFAYVVDRSGSMTGSKIERLRQELARSVNG